MFLTTAVTFSTPFHISSFTDLAVREWWWLFDLLSGRGGSHLGDVAS